MTEPLLARGPGSPTSSQDPLQQGIEEEDALLTGQRTGKTQDQQISNANKNKWREIGLFIWAVLATAAVVVLAVVYQHGKAENVGRPPGSPGGDDKDSGGGSVVDGKKNLVFMVSDGMGPTSLALTRTWRQFNEGLAYDDTLVLDNYMIGQSRTRSTSSLVTDSAAGATAFSCGFKTYNGAISVLDDFSPCGSVMEAAKRAGYTTGLVVTTRITDATPAVFASHARKREMEDAIARQMIGETHPLGFRVVDLMMGGGRCHFLPNTTEHSCRKDRVDVVATAKKQGWKYIDSRKEFDQLGSKPSLPMMGLFASHDFPYEIDRQYENDVYPSLEEMTKTALRALDAATKGSDKGFFIMIEGSRIDHAGHANDPGAQVREVLAYDRAMSAVLDFIEMETDTPTLMVSTSDHETGGLAVARQLHPTYPDYLWYPGVLVNVSHSASHAAHEYHAYIRSSNLDIENLEPAKTVTRSYLTRLTQTSFGIHDCSASEIDTLISEPRIAAYHFADMVSRRAQTGWSTHGHSGADVNIYASDPALARDLEGNHENTDVGAFLRKYLGVEKLVEDITNELRELPRTLDEGDSSWLGKVPAEHERLDGQDHLEHYTGDHKMKRDGSGVVCDICGL